MENELVIAEIVEQYDLNRQTVGEAIREGRLPARKRGKVWFVKESDVTAYIARTRPDGVKPKGRPKKSEKGKEDNATV